MCAAHGKKEEEKKKQLLFFVFYFLAPKEFLSDCILVYAKLFFSNDLFYPAPRPVCLAPPPLSLPGCLRDLRLNGRSVPLAEEQQSEGVQVVTSQGVSAGCPSDACRKHQCAPPLVCLDLWRHHECRCLCVCMQNRQPPAW